MGQQFSCIPTSQIACNYHCPVCKTSGKIPNINGRFFIINDTQCQCNGCNSIFEKKDHYLKVVLDTVLQEDITENVKHDVKEEISSPVLSDNMER